MAPSGLLASSPAGQLLHTVRLRSCHPWGPVSPACAQPKVLLFTLASVHLGFVFLARHAWRGTAVTARKVQLACLSLLPPGRIHLSGCRNSAHFPPWSPALQGPPVCIQRCLQCYPGIFAGPLHSTPALPHELLTWEGGGVEGGVERGRRGIWAVGVNKAGCSTQQNPSCGEKRPPSPLIT